MSLTAQEIDLPLLSSLSWKQHERRHLLLEKRFYCGNSPSSQQLNMWNMLLIQLKAAKSFKSNYKLLTALTAFKAVSSFDIVHNSFHSCYKLSTSLTAVKRCYQFWQLLQTVVRFDSCYKLLEDLTAVTSSCQIWQLFQAVGSFGSCYKLSAAFSSCRQLWQLLQAVASIDMCSKMLTALTSCWQLF